MDEKSMDEKSMHAQAGKPAPRRTSVSSRKNLPRPARSEILRLCAHRALVATESCQCTWIP
jgi:hypothetical protein